MVEDEAGEMALDTIAVSPFVVCNLNKLGLYLLTSYLITSDGLPAMRRCRRQQRDIERPSSHHRDALRTSRRKLRRAWKR